MQARTLLAIVATLQLIAICLNFTLATWVIWVTLPFAIISFIGVFLAIYCGWRMGIWIFIGKPFYFLNPMSCLFLYRSSDDLHDFHLTLPDLGFCN